jgi:hypothetical protein
MRQAKFYLDADGTMYRLDVRKHPVIMRFLANKWDEIIKSYNEMKEKHPGGLTVGYTDYPYYTMNADNWAKIEKQIGKKIKWDYVVVCYEASNRPVVLLKRENTFADKLQEAGLLDNVVQDEVVSQIMEEIQNGDEIEIIQKELDAPLIKK